MFCYTSDFCSRPGEAKQDRCQSPVNRLSWSDLFFPSWVALTSVPLWFSCFAWGLVYPPRNESFYCAWLSIFHLCCFGLSRTTVFHANVENLAKLDFCKETFISDANAIYQFDWVYSKRSVSQLCYFGVFSFLAFRADAKLALVTTYPLQKLLTFKETSQKVRTMGEKSD